MKFLVCLAVLCCFVVFGDSVDNESRPQRPWKPRNGSTEGPRRRHPLSPNGGPGRRPSKPSPPMRRPGGGMSQKQPSKAKNGTLTKNRRGSSKSSSSMGRPRPGMVQRRPPMPSTSISAGGTRRAMTRRIRIQRRLARMRALIGMFARRLALRRRARRGRNDDDTEDEKKKRMENFLDKVKAMIENEDGDKKNKTRNRSEPGARLRGGQNGQYGRKKNKSKDNSEMNNDESRPGKRHESKNDTDKRPGPMSGGRKIPLPARALGKIVRRRNRESFLRRALKVLLKWKEDDDKDEEEKKSLEDLISKIQDVLEEDDPDEPSTDVVGESDEETEKSDDGIDKNNEWTDNDSTEGDNPA